MSSNYRDRVDRVRHLRKMALREDSRAGFIEHALANWPKRVDIDGTEFYVVEGDVLKDPDEFELWASVQQVTAEAFMTKAEAGFAEVGSVGSPSGLETKLVGIIGDDGKIVKWGRDVVLTYRVIRETFTTEEKYSIAVDAMRRATEDWVNTCDVAFQHLAELDGRPGLGKEGAVFTVRELNAGGAFIAAAFFPNDPPSRWRVVLDPSFWTSSFDRVGVLRHELGHSIGFRHEHIRSGAPAVCPDEPLADTIPLTAYDPKSVMHYFCGGAGTRDLNISDLDRQGAREVYGAPSSAVTLVRPPE